MQKNEVAENFQQLKIEFHTVMEYGFVFKSHSNTTCDSVFCSSSLNCSNSFKECFKVNAPLMRLLTVKLPFFIWNFVNDTVVNDLWAFNVKK